jgi:hypothetical protein
MTPFLRSLPRFHTTLGSTLFALALGCSGSDSAPTDTDSNPACGAEPFSFAITDETNYAFTNTVDVAMTTLKDATDLTFDWSALTRDFFGRTLDPLADINMVMISLWEQTPEELEASIARDQLERSEGEGAIMTYPDGSYTSQNLLSFGVLGNPLPEADEIWSRFDTSHPDFEYPQDQYTFLLTANTGTTAGKDSRMLAMFNLDPASTNTALSLTDDSAVLDFTVDLKRATPVVVPARQPSLTIDWNAMTTNALGNEYLPAQITEAVVAHFDTTSLAELEDDFVNLEELADGWWSGEVASGTSIDLAMLHDANGAFPGIDENGTWLVALFCTIGCNNPAPWSITILSACE